MPKFDMDQEKATIISWEKHEGDIVRMDETVLTVETDKVAIEVPCPADGVLAGIRYQNGETVPVTTVIAFVLKQGETVADLPKDSAPPLYPSLKLFQLNRQMFPPRQSHPWLPAPVAARMAKEGELIWPKSALQVTR